MWFTPFIWLHGKELFLFQELLKPLWRLVAEQKRKEAGSLGGLQLEMCIGTCAVSTMRLGGAGGNLPCFSH